MKNNNKKTLKKLAILVIGSIIAAYGITLALYAGFGGATLAVLWQGIARTFHISIGNDFVCVGTGLYAPAFLDRGSYEAVTFALAEEITGRLNLSEWHWIFWLLLQVFCLAESLVYARLLQLSFQAQLSNLLMRKQNKF